MQYMNINGFLNGSRYKRILIWRKQELGKWTNLVFSGEILDNFSIKRARKRSTRTEELKTNKEVYCCDSIYLEFNKLDKCFVETVKKSDFSIFEIGFMSSNGKIRKYHISFNTMRYHWKECTIIQNTDNKIIIELNDIRVIEE